MGRVVYHNGAFVPERQASISIYDSALMFGDMVFEMTRSFRRRHFRLEEHIERLFDGLTVLRIECGLTREELLDICIQTAEMNEPHIPVGDEHRLMINVSRGPLGIYHQALDRVGPTVVVADFPLSWTVASLAPLVHKGINAVIPSQRAIPSSLLDPKVKNRSRLHYQMANIQVAAHSGDNNWALLVDPEGHVAEGTGSNIFIVRRGEVLTPRGENILRGISRQFVLELCHSLGLPAREVDLDPFDVMTADEAFMTGTPFCMLPITSIDGVPLRGASPDHAAIGAFGQISSRIVAAWIDSVGLDFLSQLNSFGDAPTTEGPSPYRFTK